MALALNMQWKVIRVNRLLDYQDSVEAAIQRRLFFDNLTPRARTILTSRRCETRLRQREPRTDIYHRRRRNTRKSSPPIIKAGIYYRALHCGVNLLSRLDLSPAETSRSVVALRQSYSNGMLFNPYNFAIKIVQSST